MHHSCSAYPIPSINIFANIPYLLVDPQNQGKGYGKALIDFLASKYADEYSSLFIGTTLNDLPQNGH